MTVSRPITLRRAAAASALAAAALIAAPVQAGEVIGGVFAHEVDTPFSLDTYEDGTDFEIGVRSDPIEGLSAIGKPQAHLFASINSAGDTSFIAAGLSWPIGVAGPVYVRPGIGLAVHDAPSFRVNPAGTARTDFGSRVLFEPELSVGVRASDRLSLEASWVHISNGRVFNGTQNPGLDTMGLRVGYRF